MGEPARPAPTPGLLAQFDAAGMLAPADLHVAQRIGRLGGEAGDEVLLAVALTVRALRMGSVCVDLATVNRTVLSENEELVDLSALTWPEPEQWLRACAASPVVSVGADGPSGRPMRLVDGLLYLDRYWRQEEQVRVELVARAAATPPTVDIGRARAALDRLFDDDAGHQRAAAAVSACRWVTVLAGGPGTGKTTTVARLLALLRDQPGLEHARVALAAPTGKAAARLQEAVREAEMPLSDRDRLGDLRASTLHRLLGVRPDSRSRFRHDRSNRLPYDVIVVDETSMVSLTMMARLLEAIRPDTRLILVGDPDQLASVEAGAVLGDLARARGVSNSVVEERLAELLAGPTGTDGVVTLEKTWRFTGRIADLAAAVQAGDADAAIAVLRTPGAQLEFVEAEGLETWRPGGLDGLRADVLAAGTAVTAAAQRGDGTAALQALESHRLLCAHRRGPYGVARWAAEVSRWLEAPSSEWYPGRPLLVTINDYDLGLYNGDTAVVISTADGLRAAFARGGAPTLIPPVRLAAVQTVHAMTVHRAQGSQFDRVSVLLPPAESPLLTRELLYTAITRARSHVRVIGTEDAIRAAVARPVNRASGLRARLSS